MYVLNIFANYPAPRNYKIVLIFNINYDLHHHITYLKYGYVLRRVERRYTE